MSTLPSLALPECSGMSGSPEVVRARLVVRGVVQGVGFRPFVFRVATELALGGWVSNSPQGVFIEVEGTPQRVETFRERLEAERPVHSSIQSLETTFLEPLGLREFEIRPSAAAGEPTALVLPDIATCPDCLREILDPHDRRLGYPFTNCTHCGPRFSILRALPYDRANTSMAGFTMCSRCAAEYGDPRNRRFHAQPNACPECGPQLAWWGADGRVLAERAEALARAIAALREGAIVALKGLGGFHLMVPAGDAAAVRRLRERKRREAKPLALMVRDLAMAGSLCEVAEAEARLLRSPEAPIVLMTRRRGGWDVAEGVAPDNPYLGVMLPYTPLHHLLVRGVGAPLVATSGNLSDEPICTDEAEARDRLAGVADFFLVHDRPIVRHVDDSVVRVVLGREMVLRRARGYAPLPILVRETLPVVLGVGGHLKNTVALSHGGQVFLSQHVGDLETPQARAAMRRVGEDLCALFAVQPEAHGADIHPDYASTPYAHEGGGPVICVQHHYAHVLACMAENDTAAPLLGVSWDGTGLGTDQTIWGGEFLRITETGFERCGHLRAFRLPGGEKAVKEPRRSALGLLYALLGDAAFHQPGLATLAAFKPAELRGLRQMLEAGVNAPVTSSAGRLFDAVASLTGLRQTVRFEGQAAMDLEFALERDDTEESYPVRVVERDAAVSGNGDWGMPCAVHADCQSLVQVAPRWVLDWEPMVRMLLEDLGRGVPAWEISGRFHNALAEGIVAMARTVGERRVVLSGGCFQNRYLLTRVVDRLRSEGFSPYWHQRVPTNDGGIALGQVMGAARALKKGKS